MLREVASMYHEKELTSLGSRTHPGLSSWPGKSYPWDELVLAYSNARDDVQTSGRFRARSTTIMFVHDHPA